MKRAREDEEEGEMKGHPLSIYDRRKPDFASLGRLFPSLASFLEKGSIDFADPTALAELTKALLFVDFDLKVSLPPDRLCPTVTSRLNYILYLSDLLQRDPRLRIDERSRYVRESFGGDSDVLGLDIGCGASAIYSLLGHRLLGWRFVCSELDPVSLSAARLNAEQNGFGSDVIRFVQAPDSSAAMRCCFDEGAELPMFTMCNPPFFEEVAEAAQGPRNTVISDSEAATNGGEVEFVGRLIEDSVYYGTKIALYSSLLGKKACDPFCLLFANSDLSKKKSSLKPLRALLRQHKCPVVHVTRLEQGRTHRWVLAWSFRAPLFPRLVSRPPGDLFDSVAAWLTSARLQLLRSERATLVLQAELPDAFVFSFQLARDHKGRTVASTVLDRGDRDMFKEFELMLVENVKWEC